MTTAPDIRPRRFFRGFKAATLAAVAAPMLLYAGWLLATNNFHAVVPGILYRSAQPSASDIEAYAERYGIRTIVNLRGRQANAGWYDEELSAAARLGIRHIDFGMSAAKRLDAGRVAKLVAILKSAPTPILVHCRSGSDRTGLVAALYVAAVAKLGEEAAESQLSILYGHIGLPVSYSFAMDTSFEDAEPSLGFFGS